MRLRHALAGTVLTAGLALGAAAVPAHAAQPTNGVSASAAGGFVHFVTYEGDSRVCKQLGDYMLRHQDITEYSCVRNPADASFTSMFVVWA